MRLIALLCLVAYLLPRFTTSQRLGSFAVSDRAPLAAALDRVKESSAAVDTLLWHFSAVGNAAKPASCMVVFPGNGFFSDVRTRFPHRAHEPVGCVTSSMLKNHGPPVWNAMKVILSTLNSSATSILSDTKVGWPRLYARDAFQTYKGEGCSVYHSTGLRLNNTYYLRIRVTSTPPEAPGIREYLSELITRDSQTGKLTSIAVPVNRTNGEVMERATTLVTFKKSNRYFLNVAGTTEGRQRLFDFRRWQKVAEETLHASNIGSLALPLLLALLPLSIFSPDPNTLFLTLYGLLTDVCNVLPLAFKGGELISFARNPPFTAFDTTYSLDVPSQLGGIQTYVLGCDTRQYLSYVGAGFITLSIMTMLLGMYLELYFYRKLGDDKKKMEDTNHSIVNIWAQERRCVECSCPHSHPENAIMKWGRRRRQSITGIRYIPGVYSLAHNTEG